jgi:CRISPR/Cas system-associated endonuclease Cas1
MPKLKGRAIPGFILRRDFRILGVVIRNLITAKCSANQSFARSSTWCPAARSNLSSCVGAAFVMLDRRGKVLAVTGPVSPSDAKLRRVQALALGNGTALKISKELISQKLAGQERCVRDMLHDPATADAIARFRDELPSAESIESVRLIESQAARAYWQAWSEVPIRWPRKDERSVAEHWKRFGSRISPLSHSPRLASNPPNSLLNFLYALLESESRLSAAAMGLDPGIGLLHADTPNRDSLACDIMEVCRPRGVDAFVLNWLQSEPLRRSDFWEFLALILFLAPAFGQISPSFIGLDQNGLGTNTNVRPTSLRLWDVGTTWAELNPANGVYNWAPLDKLLENAKVLGITDLLMTLSNTPQWASSKSDPSCKQGHNSYACSPPTDIATTDQHWKDYVAAVVAHTEARLNGRPHIATFEMWNEPGWTAHYNGTYVQMVRLVNDACAIIHAHSLRCSTPDSDLERSGSAG